MTFTHTAPVGWHMKCFSKIGTQLGGFDPFLPTQSYPAICVRSEPFLVPRGGRTLLFKGKLTPPLSRNLEQSSIQRLDWTSRSDRDHRQTVYRDREYAKGYRACGGYGTAEVWLMELAWLEAEAAAVLLVLPRIDSIDCRRSTVTVEIGQSSLAG